MPLRDRVYEAFQSFGEGVSICITTIFCCGRQPRRPAVPRPGKKQLSVLLDAYKNRNKTIKPKLNKEEIIYFKRALACEKSVRILIARNEFLWVLRAVSEDLAPIPEVFEPLPSIAEE